MNAPVPQPEAKPPLTDVAALREAARRHIEEGAVTEHYQGDREKVIQLLNEALATELVCVLRYRHNYFMARGLRAKVAAAEFLEHANAELSHADLLAERIIQLGGEPNFNPDGLRDRSHAEYRIGANLQEMIHRDRQLSRNGGVRRQGRPHHAASLRGDPRGRGRARRRPGRPPAGRGRLEKLIKKSLRTEIRRPQPKRAAL